MIYIASDHGGFNLKESVKKFLQKKKMSFVDLGPGRKNPADDYPLFAAKVGAKVSKNPNRDVGILLCRSGQGVNVVANKFKGVRAVVVWNVIEAKFSRIDDMANVLSLPSDYISPHQASHIIETWLQTAWSQEERHLRRINEIIKVEKKNFK